MMASSIKSRADSGFFSSANHGPSGMDMKTGVAAERAAVTRIVFWEPCISPHKASWISAIAAIRPDLEIICCAQEDVPPARQAMGWAVDAPQGFRNIVAPDADMIALLVSGNVPSTLHVFSGIRWVRCIVLAMAQVKAAGARYAIMSEPRVSEGCKGKLRMLHSWLTESYHRRHAGFVLAIGRNGPAWFRRTGYSQQPVIPFAYFVEPPLPALIDCRVHGTLRVGYLGRLVEAKGIFDLARAVPHLSGGAVLKVAGSGADEVKFRAACSKKGIRAEFFGVLPINSVGLFLNDLDVLVLASTTSDDGWGVVVSEALMSGVAVVASSMVGASVLLDQPLFGRCVRPGAPREIAESINALRRAGEFGAGRRRERAQLASALLSSQAGAQYFARVLDWYQGLSAMPPDFHRLGGQGA